MEGVNVHESFAATLIFFLRSTKAVAEPNSSGLDRAGIHALSRESRPVL